MSLSDDTWLSTRNKTKVQVKQGPLKRRASLPKSKRPQPSGVYTLTQTSPPPKELFTATKQSKLNEFFGRKRVVSAVEPENVGHYGEEQKENLEDTTSSSKLGCIRTSKIEKQESCPLRETKVKDLNSLMVDNKGLKRILSDDVEECVTKRFKTGSNEVEIDLDKDDVQITEDGNKRSELEMRCSAKMTPSDEENRQRDELHKQKDLHGVTLDRTISKEDSPKSSKIKELKSVICDNDNLEKVTHNSTEFNYKPESDGKEYISNENYGFDVKNRNNSRCNNTASLCILKNKETSYSKMRVTNCAGTLKDTGKDGESRITRGRDESRLDFSLNLSESSFRSNEEESLNLQTQTYEDHPLRDGLNHDNNQSQLHLSDLSAESEDSLVFCTQFSLSNA